MWAGYHKARNTYGCLKRIPEGGLGSGNFASGINVAETDLAVSFIADGEDTY